MIPISWRPSPLLLLLALVGGTIVWTDGPMQAQTAMTPTMSKEQWQQDLRFLATELPKRHANAFHFLLKDAFAEEVSQLDRELGSLNRDEIFVGMERIENSIGDGHTYMRVPGDAPMFPVHFERFGNDYRLVAAQDTPRAREALGGRLLRIDDTPINRAQELLIKLTPGDETQALRDLRATTLLNDGMVLHGLGITSDRDTVRYTVRTDDGSEATLELHGAITQFRPVVTTDIFPAGWIHSVAHPALYLQRRDEGFWCTYLRESHTGYCNFRSYDDLKHTSRALKRLMKDEQPQNLVIDLRLNTGGDFTKGLKYVVNPIRHMSRVNRRGHLFVLIGPRTFSAAMANAADFRKSTKAILAGQPSGEKPNSYQEAREMVLPNSHWIARYSIKFYRFVSGGENLISPDQEVDESWADFEAGRDPVMEWVLLRIGGAVSGIE